MPPRDPVASVAVANAPASAARPCWETLLNDEYDGHIDSTYPAHCYKQAIAHLPKDSLVYGQLKQDITRAMLRSIAALKKKGVKVTVATPLPPSRDLQATTHSTIDRAL